MPPPPSRAMDHACILICSFYSYKKKKKGWRIAPLFPHHQRQSHPLSPPFFFFKFTFHSPPVEVIFKSSTPCTKEIAF